jgi:hypothetical protein
MTCNPKNIIRPDRGTERVRFNNGNTDDIITVIMDMDARSGNSINIDSVECLRGRDRYETLRNVWKFLHNNIRYKPDARGREKVKSPAALFASGSGDCKSFSIAIVALLRELGFSNLRYRFTSYTPGGDVTHVYVIAKYGGKDVFLDAVHSKFDDEVPYSWKMDKKASAVGSNINGLGDVTPMSLNSVITIFSMGLIGWGIYKLS